MNKVLYVFDFDGTLIESEARVTIFHANGNMSHMNSTEFSKYKEMPGDEYDFSEFEIYPPGGQLILSTFKILKNLTQQLGTQDIVILTARSMARPVKQFLKDAGLNVHVPVVAVGSMNPLTKAAYVAKRLKTGNYDSVYLYEDNLKNISAIRDIVKNNDVKFDYTLVNINDKKLNKNKHLREFIHHTLREKKKIENLYLKQH